MNPCQPRDLICNSVVVSHVGEFLSPCYLFFTNLTVNMLDNSAIILYYCFTH